MPFSIRYPRGEGVMIEWKTPMKEIKIGTGRKMIHGDDVAILTIGPVGNFATEACAKLEAENISAAHYDMRFAKPIDELLLHEVFGKFKTVITVEDGTLVGGMGSAVLEFMADHELNAIVKRLGIPDQYIEHGEQPELWKECGYDAEAIAAAVREVY